MKTTRYALVLAAAVASGISNTAVAEETPSPEAVTEATTIYDARCALCHGTTGKGDGIASTGLTPPPRDLTSAAWQSSVNDEYIETIIKFGGSAVGKSAAMPPNPDLQAKDDVVKALRARVRGFAAK